MHWLWVCKAFYCVNFFLFVKKNIFTGHISEIYRLCQIFRKIVFSTFSRRSIFSGIFQKKLIFPKNCIFLRRKSLKNYFSANIFISYCQISSHMIAYDFLYLFLSKKLKIKKNEKKLEMQKKSSSRKILCPILYKFRGWLIFYYKTSVRGIYDHFFKIVEAFSFFLHFFITESMNKDNDCNFNTYLCVKSCITLSYLFIIFGWTKFHNKSI